MTLRISNGLPFTVLSAEVRDRTGIQVRVYDRDAPATLIDIVAHSRDRQWTDRLSDPGHGKFLVHEHDPVLERNPTLLDWGNVVRFRLDGIDRFAFRIEGLMYHPVPEDEDGGRWIEVSGRGVLSILEDATLYLSGGLTGNIERPFNNLTPGGVMRRILDEATARGALNGVTRTFDDNDDSEGEPFPENMDLQERAGTDYLSIVRRHSELLVDVDMSPQLALNYYVEKGVDRSTQTPDLPPIVLRPGHNVKAADIEREGVIKNTLLIETPGGWTERQDGGSVTTYKRRETFLSLGNTDSTAQITQAADAVLREHKDPRDRITITIEDVAEHRPYADFGIGDYVLAPDHTGSLVKWRVRAITVSEDINGVPIFVPELASHKIEVLEKLQKWLKRMSNGTVGGTSADVASPTLDPATQASVDDAVDTHNSTASHPDEINDLSDVDTTGVVDGKILKYNATSGKWEIDDDAGGGSSTGENLSIAKPYTTSPSPNATYPEYVVESDTGSGFASSGGVLTDGGRANAEDFTRGFLGFQNPGSPVEIRLDLGSAQSGFLFRAWGMYGSDSIGRPTAVKLEYSDDDAAWTTVEDRTGLGAAGQPGRRHWMAEFDISGEGSHRYWRVSLTKDGTNTWLFVSEIEFLT